MPLYTYIVWGTQDKLQNRWWSGLLHPHWSIWNACVYTWKTRIWLDTTWLCPWSSIPMWKMKNEVVHVTVTPPHPMYSARDVRFYEVWTVDQGRMNLRSENGAAVVDLPGWHWWWQVVEGRWQETCHWRH